MESEFKRVLDDCLDILRDNDGVTGEKVQMCFKLYIVNRVKMNQQISSLYY
jgi:hypothetical protein